MQHAWPDHFPEDCPPNASDSTEGRVYRFVAANPPTAEDFVSWKQLNPKKDYGVKACQSCGLSVLTE